PSRDAIPERPPTTWILYVVSGSSRLAGAIVSCSSLASSVRAASTTAVGALLRTSFTDVSVTEVAATGTLKVSTGETETAIALAMLAGAASTTVGGTAVATRVLKRDLASSRGSDQSVHESSSFR